MSRRRKAFTLVEILLAITVIAIFFGLIFAFYKNAIEKAKYVEAVATVANIAKTEEMQKIDTGEYVAAANTQEVNERLGLNIEPRWFNYKVIGVTDDNFIVLAERILDDIESGALAGDQIVVARDNSGPISPDSINDNGDDEGDEGTPETSPDSGDSGTPPGSSSPGAGGPPGVSSPGGGGGGGGGGETLYPEQAEVPASLLDLLNGTFFGDWAYDLINNNNINVVYVDVADYGMDGSLAFWAGIFDQSVRISGQTVFVTGNTIFVDKDLPGPDYTDTAIASIITHEATHADYTYHPQQWIDATKAAHPELTDDDIHITQYPNNSIDQEYQAFNNAVDVWNEIKGTDTNTQMDFWATLQVAGEAAMKAAVRILYGTDPPDPDGLPEY